MGIWIFEIGYLNLNIRDGYLNIRMNIRDGYLNIRMNIRDGYLNIGDEQNILTTAEWTEHRFAFFVEICRCPSKSPQNASEVRHNFLVSGSCQQSASRSVAVNASSRACLMHQGSCTTLDHKESQLNRWSAHGGCYQAQGQHCLHLI
ncbi:hypothetical protein CDAR_62581 [Caerostris darwini]|uniref:Uncharacterized protein n=1 Tax=Caerostris darwini TaxID=1538125 RepID=A0AAV4UFS7_9ARAC|nr:hypothetical protein CDAR_62581 [Caerostris darwini]